MWKWIAIGIAVPVAIGLRLWIGRLLRRRRQRRSTSDRLQDLKTLAVEINEKLDRLRDRHRALLTNDRDFSVPIIGTTAEVYERIETRIRELRAEWLGMMDAWDEVQTRLNEQSSWTPADTREAGQALDRFDGAELLATIEKDVAAPLDLLAFAHEQTETAFEDKTDSLTEVHESLDRLDAKEIETRRERQQVESLNAVLEQLRSELAADPLGTLERLAGLQQSLDALRERLARVDELLTGLDDFRHEIESVEQQRRETIAEGLNFTEAGSDPQTDIDAARTNAARVREAINLGDLEPAASHLDEAFHHCDRAADLIARQRQIRDQCGELLARREANLRILESEVSRATETERLLRAEFDDDLWEDVASHREHAADLLAEITPLLTIARTETAPDRQHYLTAIATLEQVDRIERETRNRLQELEAAKDRVVRDRERVRRSFEEVRARAAELSRFLKGSSADRDRANREFGKAEDWIENWERRANSPPVDWESLEGKLEGIGDRIAKADTLAREDVRLERQVENALRKADRVIREVAGFYRAGVTANVSEAESLLAVARKKHLSQAYEEAMEAAAEAEEEAYEAREKALHRMRKEQRRSEEVRQKRISDQIKDIRIKPILGTAFELAEDWLEDRITGKSSKRRRYSKRKRRDHDD